MTTFRSAELVAVVMAVIATVYVCAPHPLRAEPPFCSLVPGSALAIVHVDQDTTLPLAAGVGDRMAYTDVPIGPRDSLLATPDTRMPAARVRLLQLDSASRRILADQGITDSQPVAFLRAAPYRSDCRTIRWTDTMPFVERGEVGYVRAVLAPRDQWVQGVPVLVIRDAWNYPYPRRRNIAYNADPGAPLAPPEAMFAVNALLEVPRPAIAAERAAADSAKRSRTLAWIRGNPSTADLEPVRSLVRQAVLGPDWEAAAAMPSRVRGTYQVELTIGDTRSRWFFRTHDRPGYAWRGADSLQSAAELLASPHILGYRIVGYAAPSRDSLPSVYPSMGTDMPLVWLATSDRPSTPANDARRTLPGMLELPLARVPVSLWDDLEAFVPRRSVRDSLLFARMNFVTPRAREQTQLPLTLRLDSHGRIRADTTLAVHGRTLRVTLERIDTLSFRRPF